MCAKKLGEITASVEITDPEAIARLREASTLPPAEVKGGRYDGLKLNYVKRPER